MGTHGYLVPYDVKRFESDWLPLRNASESELRAALNALPDASKWDDETAEEIGSGNASTLLRYLFTSVCVPAARESVTLGRYLTLEAFAKKLRSMDPTGELASLVQQWAHDPRQVREDDENILVPAPQAMLEAIWARALVVNPQAAPLDDHALQQRRTGLKDDSDEFSRLALGWLGSLVTSGGMSAAYYYEFLPTIGIAPTPPEGAAQLQQLLKERGLPPWDYIYDEKQPDGGVKFTYTWIREVSPEVSRAHAQVTDAGVQSHLLWAVPSKWKAIFSGDRNPNVTSSGAGRCPDPACRLCESALVVAQAIQK